MFPISTVGPLALLAHTDGATVLTAGPERLPGVHATVEKRAADLLTTVLRLRAPLVFPVGSLAAHGPRILAAPLPFLPPPQALIHTPQQRRQANRRRPGVYFITIAALTGTAAYHGAAMAFARTAIFRQSFDSVQEAVLVGTVLAEAARFRFGAREITSVVRGADPHHCEPASILAVTARSVLAENSLREALHAFQNPRDEAEQQYLHEWGDAVQTFDPADIPPDACASLPTLQQQALKDVPYSFPTPIVATQWLERKPEQTCGVCPGVTHCAQLISPEPRCLGALQDWWVKASTDFVTLARGLPLEPRHTPTLALGQDCLIPCARNCVWDCRVPGKVQPLNYSAEIDQAATISLDRDLLVAAMSDWPDQELRSHLRYGVRFGADLPFQIVLTPQLKSLAGAFDRTQRELRELIDKGWYALFDFFPFIPLRMHPKGATERKLENRPRPTTDGSHPHSSQQVVDTQGIPVISINEAIKSGVYGPHRGVPLALPPNSPPWWPHYATWKHAADRIPKEYKPTLGSLARDSAILAFPARCDPTRGPQPVFAFVDDFRSYFSQVPVATEDLWKTVVAGFSTPYLDESIDPQIQFIAEYRLGFGITINSNICQRLANFIIHLFTQEFRTEDEQYHHQEPECVKEWLHHRRGLGQVTGRAEDTLFRTHIYTDDPIFVVIGVQRTIRALRMWRKITQRFRFIMAIPEKRRVGTMVKWLGFLPSPMHGLIVVQRNKLLRAAQAVALALAGGIAVDQYRSLLGFLEHLKVLLDHPRRRMYGLYRPLRSGQEISMGPATLVRIDERMRSSLQAWAFALANTAAAPITYALPRAHRKPFHGPSQYISSDAAKEGALTPALAGYMHGFHWYFVYPPSWSWFPIAVLEFLALAVSVITFIPLLDHAAHITLETDSITTALVLSSDAAQSPLLVEAHSLLLDTPEYARLLSGLTAWRQVDVSHVYGTSNIAADLLSRGKHAEFQDFCMQLNVRPQRLPIPPAARAYLSRFLTAVQPFVPKELHGRGRTKASMDYDGPLHPINVVYSRQASSPSDSQPPPSASQPAHPQPGVRHPPLVPQHPPVQLALKPSTAVQPLPLGPGSPPLTTSRPPPPIIPPTNDGPGTSLVHLVHRLPLEGCTSTTGWPPPLCRLSHPLASQKPPPPLLCRSYPRSYPRVSSGPAFPVSPPSRPPHPPRGLSLHADVPPFQCHPPLHPGPGHLSAPTGIGNAAPPGRPGRSPLPTASRQQEDPLPLDYDRYQLRPTSAHISVLGFREHRDSLLQAAVPPTTLQSERRSWLLWVHHCRLWGTDPWRAYLPAYSLAAEAASAREDLLTLAASFIESCYLAMKPRKKGTCPKPSSAYKRWCDVARMHHRAGLPKLDPSQLVKFVKALHSSAVQQHGFDALLTRRKEPIRDAEHAHLLALPEATRLGPYIYHSHTLFGLTWRTLLHILNFSGFRKGEWTVQRRGESTAMTFAQLAWDMDGTIQRDALSDAQRAAIRAGGCRVFALIFPVPSKCDPDGSVFGSKAIPFRVIPDDPESPGMLLLRLEEWVAPPDRRACPLFADAAGAPLVASEVDRALRDALLLHSPAVAATRSWHSYRIRLASKLRAATSASGAPLYSDALIQSFLRWRSSSSLNTYARHDHATHADILDNVANLDITSIQYSNLPELAEFDRLDALATTAPVQLPRLLVSGTPPRQPPPRLAQPPASPHALVSACLNVAATSSSPSATDPAFSSTVPIHAAALPVSPFRGAGPSASPAPVQLQPVPPLQPEHPVLDTLSHQHSTPPDLSAPPDPLAPPPADSQPAATRRKRRPPFSTTSRTRSLLRKRAARARRADAAAPEPHPDPSPPADAQSAPTLSSHHRSLLEQDLLDHLQPAAPAASSSSDSEASRVSEFRRPSKRRPPTRRNAMRPPEPEPLATGAPPPLVVPPHAPLVHLLPSPSIAPSLEPALPCRASELPSTPPSPVELLPPRRPRIRVASTSPLPPSISPPTSRPISPRHVSEILPLADTFARSGASYSDTPCSDDSEGEGSFCSVPRMSAPRPNSDRQHRHVPPPRPYRPMLFATADPPPPATLAPSSGATSDLAPARAPQGTASPAPPPSPSL